MNQTTGPQAAIQRLSYQELVSAGFAHCTCEKTSKACVRAVAINRFGQDGPTLDCTKRGKGISAQCAFRCMSMKLMAS